jgi:hypothetical protein
MSVTNSCGVTAESATITVCLRRRETAIVRNDLIYLSGKPCISATDPRAEHWSQPTAARSGEGWFDPSWAAR